MREIIFDTETTGLDPRTGDRLIEIGAVELSNRFPTGRTFHEYLNPGRPVSQGALEIHGLTDAFLADKPRFEDIMAALIDFLADDAVLVAHNASFDMGFLNMEIERCGGVAIPADRVVDTLAIARRRHPGASNSLDALCARYGIDSSARVKHGALLDSEILAEVYIELLGGRQPGLALTVKDDSNPVGARRTAKPARPAPLPSRLTDADRAAHRTFVESLGADALWLKVGLS